MDDFQDWRQRIRFILESRPELQVVGEASDGLEAVSRAQKLKPDLILLDVGLPRLDGVKVANHLCQLVPSAKVLFVTQNNDPDIVSAALKNGAKGYVLKADAGRELLPAIEAILGGKRFVSSGIKFSG